MIPDDLHTVFHSSRNLQIQMRSLINQILSNVRYFCYQNNSAKKVLGHQMNQR